MAGYNDNAKFEELKGKTIMAISGLNVGSEQINIQCSDGSTYRMDHSQSCCENVDVNEIIGDIGDLIGSPILLAEEVENSCENPEGVKVPEYQDSWTWTFYKLSTIHGSVTIRWYGASNGYYGESVDFTRTDSKQESK